jgi:hypothetical protein
MEIEFSGRTKNMTRKETREAAKFFAEALMGPKLTPNINLIIEYEQMPDKNACVHPVDPYRNGGPRTFELTIDPRLSKSKQMRCLAHEMVHVKQMARKELKEFGEKGLAYWNGKKVKVKNANYIQYLFWPWEVEAFGLEKGLLLCYNAFMIQNGK